MPHLLKHWVESYEFMDVPNGRPVPMGAVGMGTDKGCTVEIDKLVPGKTLEIGKVAPEN